MSYLSYYAASPTDEQMMEILIFAAGVLFFYTHSIYMLLFLCLVLLLKPKVLLAACFALGMSFAFIHEYVTKEKGLPPTTQITHAWVRGMISEIPVSSQKTAPFRFVLNYFNGRPAKANILLSCYQHCPKFKTGQRWQLQVTLKKPINFANPGSFDRIAHLKAQHIHWIGYVTASHAQLLQEAPVYFISKLRKQMANNMAKAFSDKPSLSIAQALTLGFGSAIKPADWELFRRTGTTHLMVISGAHIGLLASLGYLLISALWRRSARLCLFMPAQQAGSFIGILLALGYALLSGLGVPAQRAAIAVSLFLAKNFLNKVFSGWQAWRYGLFCVIFIEPHAVLQPGFYLSFGAVAILFIANTQLSGHWLKKLCGLQLICLCGLLPMTLYWFSYGALNGFFANLLAIPFVGYGIVPLALLSMILAQWTTASWIFLPIQSLIKLLLNFLQGIDHLSWLNISIAMNETTFLALSCVMLVLLIGLSLNKLWLVLAVVCLSLLVPKQHRPKLGEAKMVMLDVGQGLATVIQTATHTLIYDTGVKFYQGGDMGRAVILPYLQHEQMTHIDKIIISHPDNDHQGGLASLRAAFPKADLLGNRTTTQPHLFSQKNCHHTADWQWDGVRFHFFPLSHTLGSRNNRSCVLQVTAAHQRLLLTGDIEKPAEEALIAHYGRQLASTVLVVPHHGSKTSSSKAFIQQVRPQYALISAGLNNRYHFPHAPTLRIFEQFSIPILNTAFCGMITVLLKKPLEVSCYGR